MREKDVAAYGAYIRANMAHPEAYLAYLWSIQPRVRRGR